MTSYSAPGVYVELVPSGARPIGAVGTSTAGFVGAAPDAAARLHEPVAVNSWTDFVRAFVPEGATSTPLALAVYGFFANGGGRCYVVNTGGGPIAGSGRERTGLRVLEGIDEVAIVAAPGAIDAESHEALLSHAEQMDDRLAICDGPSTVPDVEVLTRVGTATARPTAPARAAAAGPDAAAGDEVATRDAAPATTDDRDGAGAGGVDAGGVDAGDSDAGGGRPRQSDHGAFYFPHLVVPDPLGRELVTAPPSGHMAGIWARTDATRGVHKAPANEPVRGAVDLTYRVTRQEQELLNPAGVNCIRFFTNEGIRVWGARTLAGEASEWRYVPVRRLFTMLKESIAEGTRWVVFEPNDMTLWKSIRRDIGAFLTRVWRDGALMGRTPQEAFFVKCDEETNPPEVRDAGQVVALVGVAPVKPAEFVVFKLSQWAGGAGEGV